MLPLVSHTNSYVESQICTAGFTIFPFIVGSGTKR
jgi:hypothetical protein